MAKVKSYFFCSECGYQSSSWLGKCPECGKWNTFSEEVVQAVKPASSSKLRSPLAASAPKPISQVVAAETQRIPTGCAEFDRVLGGGIVPGSLILLGGEPGIGKSTLLLQTALNIPGRRILYVSGEESEQQIKMRADRLMGERKAESGERKAESEECYVVSETVTQRIMEHIEQVRPDILVVDSIQTISTETIDSSAGSISQIRECTAEFQRLAKENALPILLVGHITKDGNLAGPKVMEHIVDCVLQFEGDRNYGYRMLRSLKNRFGSTAEIGIFEMQGDGLREVSNPSEFLLSQRDENLSGCAVAATLEGARPMFIEVQSLVSSAVYGTPQRNANGFDFRRLSMLLAVLEKRCGFKLGAKDVFLNIAGGIRVSDPAIDLAVACSVLSSNVDIPISPRYCFAAEMGLSGEVRPVSRVEQRIAEADRIGFEKIFVSKYNMRGINKKRFGLQIVEVAVIEEAFRALFA
ncbi:MAG: DNA repair protein RadA [Bacteroidales bacterium]|nr:DNA repair protein RadA [Bacteroidales bacterium]MBR6330045.1 DNA repair protein RadA [Bacteroidales bacterium]